MKKGTSRLWRIVFVLFIISMLPNLYSSFKTKKGVDELIIQKKSLQPQLDTTQNLINEDSINIDYYLQLYRHRDDSIARSIIKDLESDSILISKNDFWEIHKITQDLAKENRSLGYFIVLMFIIFAISVSALFKIIRQKEEVIHKKGSEINDLNIKNKFLKKDLEDSKKLTKKNPRRCRGFIYKFLNISICLLTTQKSAQNTCLV